MVNALPYTFTFYELTRNRNETESFGLYKLILFQAIKNPTAKTALNSVKLIFSLAQLKFNAENILEGERKMRSSSVNKMIKNKMSGLGYWKTNCLMRAQNTSADSVLTTSVDKLVHIVAAANGNDGSADPEIDCIQMKVYSNSYLRRQQRKYLWKTHFAFALGSLILANSLLFALHDNTHK